MNLFLKIIFLILAYLIGSIPFGLIISLLKGHDIREEGSKNIGATNVGRVLGKKYAVLTYFLDMLKGFIFVFLFNIQIIPKELCIINPLLYGLLANIGHCFPIYLKFKGGKSVSCGSGAIAGYCPVLLPIMLLIFFIIKKIGKLVSLSSLLTTLIVFVGCVIYSIISKDFLNMEASTFNGIFAYPINYWFLIFNFGICSLLYIKHIPNIKRLFKGEEKPINY